MASEEDNSATTTIATIGTVLAIILSWKINASILWAILHGFLSWLYVFYYMIKYW